MGREAVSRIAYEPPAFTKAEVGADFDALDGLCQKHSQ